MKASLFWALVTFESVYSITRAFSSAPKIIVSPSLFGLGGHHMVLTIPSGVVVKSRDEESEWSFTEYDVEFTKEGIQSTLGCAILQWPLSRSERKGFCEGSKIKINAKIRAWRTEFQPEASGEHYDVLCYSSSPNAAIVIECITQSRDRSRWRSSIRKLFESFQVE